MIMGAASSPWALLSHLSAASCGLKTAALHFPPAEVAAQPKDKLVHIARAIRQASLLIRSFFPSAWRSVSQM